MSPSEDNNIVWLAPSGKEYAFPKDCKGLEMVGVLQYLLKNNLRITYNMVKTELGLI